MTGHVHGGGARTVFHGNVFIDEPGTVLSDTFVHGRVSVDAANVTIKGCYIGAPESCPECDAA